jgi:sodium-dependent phosphate cotransporter
VALCHLVFNLFGTVVFLPLSFLPIRLARMLGQAAARRRWVALVYVLVVFFVIPGILIAVS